MSHTIMFENVYSLVPKLKRKLSPELAEELDTIIALYERKINGLLLANGELEAKVKGLNEEIEKLDHEIGNLQQEYDALFLELRESQQGIGNIRGY